MNLIIIIFCISSVVSEACILKKSRCSSALIHECVWSDEELKAKENLGYEGLGCFNMSYPWSSMLRPLPAPDPPAIIDVQIYLFTRIDFKRHNVHLWPAVDVTGLDFDPHRKTMFIIHGFSSNGNASWVTDMAEAFLYKVDANVFVVNWKKGAASKNYLKAASNTRIVGAEISRFLKYLIEVHNLNVSTVHLVGHSLGAHIAAYAAKSVKGIGRITALDPAQPGFEGTNKTVRLAKGDADFIDVVHTNARPFIPFLGFGMMAAIGDVDFFMNGGLDQPGCRAPRFVKSVKSLKEISGIDLKDWVTCSHTRAHDYFTSALKSSCKFIGKKVGKVSRVTSALTLGKFGKPSRKPCTPDTCIPLGLETSEYKARGAFAIATTEHYPFCDKNGTSSNES